MLNNLMRGFVKVGERHGYPVWSKKTEEEFIVQVEPTEILADWNWRIMRNGKTVSKSSETSSLMDTLFKASFETERLINDRLVSNRS